VHDKYEWLHGGKLIEESGFDRYGIRTVFSYIKATLKLDKITVEKENNSLVLNGLTISTQTLINDITTICLWTNFRVLINETKLTLEPRGNDA
jgi:hypothetical protein